MTAGSARTIVYARGATASFGRARKTLYCGCRRPIGKSKERHNLRQQARRLGERRPRNKTRSMDNPENPSKWDDLARELGAEAPPEPVIAPKSGYTSESKSEEPHRKTEPPPKLKPKPPAWDHLAADLGIEVPPPPPAPAEPQTPVAESYRPIESSHEPVRSREEESRRQDDRPPRRERSPRREGPSDASEKPPRPPRPPRDQQHAERPRRGRRDSPRQQRGDGPRQREDRARRESDDTRRREREDVPEPMPEEVVQLPIRSDPVPEQETKPEKSLGVSLWHKIFGSPGEQAERIAESTRIEDTKELTGLETSNEVIETWHRESVEVEFTELGDAESSDAVEHGERTTGESGEPRRRRRRRGRGRGRGRHTEGESSDSEQPREAVGEGDDRPREPRDAGHSRERRPSRERGSRSGRPRRESAHKQVDPKDDFDDGLEEIVLDDVNESDDMEVSGDGEGSAATGGRETSAGHRSIPSWNEAIGMIVDTNLATRTDRRRSTPSQSRGSGPSRGRREAVGGEKSRSRVVDEGCGSLRWHLFAISLRSAFCKKFSPLSQSDPGAGRLALTRCGRML